jgi:4-amino-4-deoxy-L-arabinose transferase-like glycosyltransferase
MSLLPLRSRSRGRAGSGEGVSELQPEGRGSLVGAAARRLDPLLIAIMALAAFLRFWDLGRVGLRGDEAVYAGQAAVLAGAKGFSPYFILQSRGDSNFLLFQGLVSVVYRVAGAGDVTARAVAAAFSVLTVAVVYGIGATLFGRRTGLFSALLLSVGGYSVMLGRLALLDSTLTFLFATAMLCAAKWTATKRSGWLYGFAAAAALTVQAKIVGGLALLVVAAYLLISRSTGELTWRRLLICAGVFLAALTPMLVQLASNWTLYSSFLSTSVRRASAVPWYYYGKVLLAHDGPFLLALYIIGIAFAVGRRARGDLLPLLWLLTVVVFYQIYPLKAFNYLLPSVPALCLLAARALDRLPRPSLPVVRVAATAAVAVVLVAGVIPYQWRALHDDSYAGLEEAARWLAGNSPAEAGVMTLSHGSAQYVFSFYGRRDAYPFGRFRLATVLPGGEIVHALPSTEGVTPRDWVALWPPQLMEKGTVDYLVYYATSTTIDDPEEDPLVNTSTQRKFRDLIAR